MCHGMALRGRGQGAPPWYGMKHMLMISEELATGTTGDRSTGHKAALCETRNEGKE
eukprot:COSAG02_NODE_4020_length_5892_cov_7.078716_4_plen_56_part_00